MIKKYLHFIKEADETEVTPEATETKPDSSKYTELSSEVKSMLILGNRLGYFSDVEMKYYYYQIDEIGKMLYKLSISLPI